MFDCEKFTNNMPLKSFLEYKTETLDLFNILSKICIDKNERNLIIESIDKLYGKMQE